MKKAITIIAGALIVSAGMIGCHGNAEAEAAKAKATADSLAQRQSFVLDSLDKVHKAAMDSLTASKDSTAKEEVQAATEKTAKETAKATKKEVTKEVKKQEEVKQQAVQQQQTKEVKAMNHR